jgi:sulfate permease, SulP family
MLTAATIPMIVSPAATPRAVCASHRRSVTSPYSLRRSHTGPLDRIEAYWQLDSACWEVGRYCMGQTMVAQRIRRGLKRHLPILTWLPLYHHARLRPDIVAGVVVAALAIPQSLGYASIAGVPVQVGLYAVPIALLLYAALGTSPQLIVGPVSTVSVLSATLVASMHPANVEQAVAYTSAIALAAGVVLILAGFLRVGWVAEFLSKPIVTGFVFGLTILVIIGELPNLLGIPVTPGDVLHRISTLARNINQIDPLTTLVGVSALAVLFIGQRLLRRVPWALVVLILGLAASHWLHLAARGVAVVGPVPKGLPTPSIPDVPLTRLVDVAFAGAAIAFIGLAEGLSAGRLYAAKGGYRLDTNQELIAAGGANIGSGFFGGLGVAGSLSKTAAVDRAGGKSQVGSISAAAIAIIAILLVAPALSALPKAVLSAIVINAVWGLLDVAAIRRYMRVRKNDGVASLVAIGGVLIAGPMLGLLIAIGESILGMVYRSGRVDVEMLGKIPGEKASWGGVRNHPERATIPGILVLRMNTPVFWVNAAGVQDAILQEVDAAVDIKALILDMGATHQSGVTTADMLSELREQLIERGVDLYLVRVRWPVRSVLRRSGFRAQLGESHLWHNVAQGVRVARRHHGIERPSTEPEPVVVEETENIDEPPEEAPAPPTRDEEAESEARGIHNRQG